MNVLLLLRATSEGTSGGRQEIRGTSGGRQETLGATNRHAKDQALTFAALHGEFLTLTSSEVLEFHDEIFNRSLHYLNKDSIQRNLAVKHALEFDGDSMERRASVEDAESKHERHQLLRGDGDAPQENRNFGPNQVQHLGP